MISFIETLLDKNLHEMNRTIDYLETQFSNRDLTEAAATMMSKVFYNIAVTKKDFKDKKET